MVFILEIFALLTIFDEDNVLELFLRSVAVYLSVILFIAFDDNFETDEFDGISFNSLNNNG